jgi:hemolysin III
MERRVKEPFNALSHLVGALVSLAGLVLLIQGSQGDSLKQLSVIVFGSTLTLMFVASSAYHGIPGSETRTRRLRKIDHAAIFALIAGSYTPLCINLFSGFWQWGILTLVWIIAVAGIISKVFIITRSDFLTVSAYLALGWLAILGFKEIKLALPDGGIGWLLAGGLLYSTGALLSWMKRPTLRPGVFSHHEVWHLFVMAGAFCHYMLVYLYVL